MINNLTASGFMLVQILEENRTEEAEALRLEDVLQRREVDDEQLTHDGGQDGVAERPVAAQTHLMDHTGLRSRYTSELIIIISLLTFRVTVVHVRRESGSNRLFKLERQISQTHYVHYRII